MSLHNLTSFIGIALILGTSFFFSTDRKNINIRIIFWGLGLQFIFAFFIFVIPAGAKIFLMINSAVDLIMASASSGAKFLFGVLAEPPGSGSSIGFILAFQGLPTIIFFSSLMSILYFAGIMPKIIRMFAGIFTRLMRISGAESLAAASNIFVGVESAFTIKPYIDKLTRSELCTLLTAGMATVSSNILAVYVFSLKEYFPNIAGHLISASILSAPAAIMISKMLLPEKEHPETLGENINVHYERESNVFEAIINGAQAGVRLIAGIAALLVAVLGIVALIDLCLHYAGNLIGDGFNAEFDLSLKGLLGYLFYPIVLALGIAHTDAGILSVIIGERLILTELVAYQDLADALARGQIQHMRSVVIATYALCGFAHIASMAIFIGGISALCPAKTRALSQVAIRSLAAATLACLLTGCVAGIFFTEQSILLQ